MKVLVTGANGLIGVYAVVEMLNQGKQVKAMVRNRDKLKACLQSLGKSLADLEVVIGDITDPDSITAATTGCDALLHCAGVFSNRQSDASMLWEANVTGTENVIRAGIEANLDPIIHVSSYLALFPAPRDKHRADDPVTDPMSMYSNTKAVAERIARKFQASGAPVVTVYPGSVQGPNDPTYGIGSLLLEQAIRHKKLLVTDGGRGYTDVRDLAQLLDRALQANRGPRRYMAGGYYLSYDELLKILRDITGRDIKAQKIPGWLLRFMGQTLDLISRITGSSFQLTKEAAQVLTRSKPSDDQPAIDELKLTRIGAEKSFKDLLDWMVATNKIPDHKK